MLVEAEIWTVAQTNQGNAVLIKPVGAQVAVPIFIGQLEAQSILIGLGNISIPRPNTHDLFISIFSTLEIFLEKVEIISLNEGIFYAQILLNKNDEILTIDSRPSDSIALAVRAKCPIYIAESIVDEAGIALSSLTEEKTTGLSPQETERNSLQKKLDKAVEEEDYEEAAGIRDRIKELDQHHPEG